MSNKQTWGDAVHVKDQVTATQRTILVLLARLPFASAQQLKAFLRLGGPASLYRHLSMLLNLGAIASIRPCINDGHPPRMFYLTDLGLAVLALDQGCDVHDLARQMNLGRSNLLRLIPDLPLLQLTYFGLAVLNDIGESPGGLDMLERPWLRHYTPLRAMKTISIQLPARAHFSWAGNRTLDCLLLPDVGLIPPSSYRPLLGSLMGLRQTAGELPVLVISTGSDAQASAWRFLIEDVARTRGECPLAAVVMSDDSDHWVKEIDGYRATAPSPTLAKGQLLPRRSNKRPYDNVPLARIVGDPLQDKVKPASTHLALTAGDRELIDVIGWYPFLSVAEVAVLLQCTKWSARAKCERLVKLGMARKTQSPLSEPGTQAAGEEVLELTAEGFRAAVGWYALPAAILRKTIFCADNSKLQSKTRDRLIRNFLHTRGVIRTVIDLQRIAAHFSAQGADEALIEWRGEASCSHRWLRPDGYGVYERAGARYGFFLEYDRGTEKAWQYDRKLTRYYEYRDSGAFEREYNGFPTILVVTTSPAAERRIAGVARRLAYGRAAPLPLLLTCTWRTEACPEGMLGKVWRTPMGEARRLWLSDSSAKSRTRRAG